MFDALSLHEKLKDHFPEVEMFTVSLKYAYSPDVPPGILIDLANAVFESVGKNAWGNLSTAPPPKKIEKAKLSDILEEAKEFFKDNDPDFYAELHDGIVIPALRILGRRSDNGDASHGHLVGKQELSYAHAATSLNLAFAYAAYYFHILDSSSEKLIYENYPDFNEWLNEKGDQIGGASFSWLLHQHDYDAYENYYDKYKYL